MSKVNVRFSSALESVTDERTTEVDASTLDGAIDELASRYGDDFEERLFDNGDLRRFVNVYVNGKDIRHEDGLETRLEDGDEVSILPAVSGGEK
ncbi:MAG: ubiquitin-like small modifier protein 1 [Halobacteria archaeon]|nr:ubiquitin-like small modifier protein 1 [Halobacteria archaeon]